MKTSRYIVCCVVSLALGAVVGCGGRHGDMPELAPVTGTVTLDGKPLEGAHVSFDPQQKGSPSGASTDSSGHYELWYNVDTKGAALGPHAVRISYRPDPVDNRERLPAIYNDESTLTAEVKAGDNTFDFDLKSEAGKAPE